MGRCRPALAIGAVTLVALTAGQPATARISGAAAKHWAGKIAAVGQRPAGGKHERQAHRIVRRRLEALGYTVRVQHFSLPDGGRSRNVLGRTDGRPRVIIVAHVDGVYRTHAANDNGSGVGLLLELARRLTPRHGILVAGVGAEERVVTGSSLHLGSYRLTRSLSTRQKDGVRLALSLDMVGYGTRLRIRGLGSSPNRSARRLLAAAHRLGFQASYLRDPGQSDHAELSRGGVPAAWVEWREDPCWHRPCDTISRLQPNRLWRAGRIVAAAARGVLD
jgi:hypothetical protein